MLGVFVACDFVHPTTGHCRKRCEWPGTTHEIAALRARVANWWVTPKEVLCPTHARQEGRIQRRR